MLLEPGKLFDLTPGEVDHPAGDGAGNRSPSAPVRQLLPDELRKGAFKAHPVEAGGRVQFPRLLKIADKRPLGGVRYVVRQLARHRAVSGC